MDGFELTVNLSRWDTVCTAHARTHAHKHVISSTYIPSTFNKESEKDIRMLFLHDTPFLDHIQMMYPGNYSLCCSKHLVGGWRRIKYKDDDKIML